MRTPIQSTLEAMDLPRTDLPVGTYVRLSTNKGYNGSRVTEGTITSKTAKSYVVEHHLFDDEKARVAREPDGSPDPKRHLKVLLTAEQNEARLAEGKVARDRMLAEQAEREAQREQERVLLSIRNDAEREVLTAHLDEVKAAIERLKAERGVS